LFWDPGGGEFGVSEGQDLALTVRQPWAELIISGRKSIEVRTWITNYRGLVWLHAGRYVDEMLDLRFGITDPPRGAFVGRVQLLSITPFDHERWELWRDRHLDPGHYRPGLFAWAMASPQRLSQPISAVGQRGLFPIEVNLAARLRSDLSGGPGD
jgi:hypothetical protein